MTTMEVFGGCIPTHNLAYEARDVKQELTSRDRVVSDIVFV